MTKNLSFKLSEILFEAANNRDTAEVGIMYSIYKKDIQQLKLSPMEYDEAIIKLTKIFSEMEVD